MADITKKLNQLLYLGTQPFNLVNLSATLKQQIKLIRQINASGTGYVSFNPASGVNSLSQLTTGGALAHVIVETVSSTPNFTLPDFEVWPTASQPLPQPGAPTWSFNSQTRILSLAGPSGYESAVLEYRVSGGAYQNYTAGLSIDGSAHVAGKWEGRVKASATNQAGQAGSSPQILAAAAPSSTDEFVIMYPAQSNGYALAPSEPIKTGGHLAGIYPKMRQAFTRSRIFAENTDNLQPAQLDVNDREALANYPGMTGGLLAYFHAFEANKSGQCAGVTYPLNGTPITAFKKQSGNPFAYTEIVRRINKAKAQWIADGLPWNASTVKLICRQGETLGDSATWKADLAQIWDDLTVDCGLPEGCRSSAHIVKTVTDSGNLAAARANVSTFGAGYSRHPYIPVDAAFLNNVDDHHWDIFSHIKFSEQQFLALQGQQPAVLYISPKQECGAGTAGLAVQDSSTVSVNDAISKAVARLVCTPTGGGTVAPTISGFSQAGSFNDEVVTVTGTGFTGTTAVRIGGAAVESFQVVSNTSLTLVRGFGAAAATGVVEVQNASGTGNSPAQLIGYDPTPTKGGALQGVARRPMLVTNPSANVQVVRNGLEVVGGGANYAKMVYAIGMTGAGAGDFLGYIEFQVDTAVVSDPINSGSNYFVIGGSDQPQATDASTDASFRIISDGMQHKWGAGKDGVADFGIGYFVRPSAVGAFQPCDRYDVGRVEFYKSKVLYLKNGVQYDIRNNPNFTSTIQIVMGSILPGTRIGGLFIGAVNLVTL